MNSKFQSIFLVSISVGALSISITDAVTASSIYEGIGFIIGFIGCFTILSLFAIINDNNQIQTTRTNKSTRAYGALTKRINKMKHVKNEPED